MESLPYEDLYTYLMKGLVSREEEASFGEFFLWNWVEENNCFLFFRKSSERIVSELLKGRFDLHLLENYHFSYE